jgi:hypothetical protein
MGFNTGSISSLASVVNMFAGADPVKAQLIPLNDDGTEDDSNGRSFQYFPEQINDSKGVNYSSKNIPGGSHPLYQFISGGDRTISFSAIFTSDENPAPPGLLSALTGGLNLSINTLTSAIGLTDAANKKKHTTNVDAAIIWLRSFIYPRYSNGRGDPLGTVVAPPVVRLYLPNSNIHGTTPNGSLVLDSIDCIMNQCDVVYDAFYRNGAQRITTVNLSFHETVQTGATNWKFADGQAFNNAWQKGTAAGGTAVNKYLLLSTKQPANTKGKGSSTLGAMGALADKANSISGAITNKLGALTGKTGVG